MRRLGIGIVAAFALAAGCQGALTPESEAPRSLLGPASPRVATDRVPSRGLWISRGEIRQLPMSGPAWQRLVETAIAPAAPPNVADQDQQNDVQLMAKALVYARTGVESFRNEVVAHLQLVPATADTARTLAVGRALPAYVIAADLVELSPSDDAAFRAWLRRCLDVPFSGELLRGTHERRPNNWGTAAGAGRIAAALYLGDRIELARAVIVYKGWLGDRDVYAGFDYGDLSWQADPARPVPINPRGAMRDSFLIDGVLPDDQRRSGGFVWPPPAENYCYEALQGALVQAEFLSRAGFESIWSHKDRALLRAFTWLNVVAQFPPQGDDTWESPLIDYHYASRFWDGSTTRPGKNVGWTDWTHGPGRVHPYDHNPAPERVAGTF